jgi:hypothetical protein
MFGDTWHALRYKIPHERTAQGFPRLSSFLLARFNRLRLDHLSFNCIRLDMRGSRSVLWERGLPM